MTDNEVLLALSNMLEPIKEDIRDMKNDITGINGEISGIKGEISGIKGEISDIKHRVKKIELTQENVILPRLQNIEACYTSTYERYKNSVDDYETVKQDVSILKKVVAEHSEILQKIS